MAAGLRFALYVWLIVSAIALIVQLVRRRRHQQAGSSDPGPMDPAILVPSQDDGIDSGGGQPEEKAALAAGGGLRDAPPLETTLADLMDGISYPESLRPLVSEGAPANPAHQCLISTRSTPEKVGLALTEELESHGFAVMGVSESEAVAQRSDGLVSLSIEPKPEESTIAGVRRFPTAKAGDVVVEIWAGGGPNPTLS